MTQGWESEFDADGAGDGDDDTDGVDDCAGVGVARQLLSTRIFAKATTLALAPKFVIAKIDSDNFLLLGKSFIIFCPFIHFLCLMMQLMLEWNVSVSSQDCSIFDGIGLAGQNLVLKKYWNRSFCLFVVRIVLICIDDE